MSSVPTYKIYVTCGDCFAFAVVYKAAGVPVNLSGCTANLRFAWDAHKDQFGRRVAAGGLTLDGVITAAQGKIEFDATPSQTAEIPDFDGVSYQLRLANLDCVFTILKGAATVSKNLFEVA